MLITLAVTAVTVPLTVITTSGAALALVMGGTVVRAAIVAALVLAFFVPPVLLTVPRFVVLAELGLADGYFPLLLPALAGTAPLFVLLYALAFARLPRGILDAAAASGAGQVRTWARIALPLARPTTFAVAVLSFAHHWSVVTDAVLHLGARRPGTVSLVLARLASLEPTYQPVLLAAVLVASLPPVLAAIIGHRVFLDRSVV
jgi:multiple sugar transport system permease protein